MGMYSNKVRIRRLTMGTAGWVGLLDWKVWIGREVCVGRHDDTFPCFGKVATQPLPAFQKYLKLARLQSRGHPEVGMYAYHEPIHQLNHCFNYAIRMHC